MGVKNVLFGGTETDSAEGDLGLLFLRIIAGFTLAIAHGMGKVPPSAGFYDRVAAMGFPEPMAFAWLAGLVEFGGGILLALGLFTRPASFLVLGQMIIVSLVAHAGDPFSSREKSVLFGAIALLYLLKGAGRFSLDAFFRNRIA